MDENPYKSPSASVPVLEPQTGLKLATTLVFDWAALVGIVILIFWRPTTFGGQLAFFALVAAVVVDAIWAWGRLARSKWRIKKSKRRP